MFNVYRERNDISPTVKINCVCHEELACTLQSEKLAPLSCTTILVMVGLRMFESKIAGEIWVEKRVF
jgi:hypothetical protein